MNLTTNRLTICEIDYEQTVGISNKNSNDNSVANHFASLSKEQLSLIISNKATVANLVSTIERKYKSQSRVHYGAWKNDELLGYISLLDADKPMPELQIEIVPEFQGQGYGYEFCLALLKYLFESETYESIRYVTLPSNIASIKLVEKIGSDLQLPLSDVEALLMRTYHISRLSIKI